MTGTRDADTVKRLRLFVFSAGVAVFLCGNLVLRLLHSKLFAGHGLWGWPELSGLELGYLVWSVCLPALAAGVLLNLVCRPWRARVQFWLGAFLGWALLAYVEGDMIWYHFSGEHLRWTQVQVLMHEDWEGYIGLDATQAGLAATAFFGSFGLGVLAMWGAGWLAARGVGRRLALVRVRTVAIFLLAGVAFDSWWIAGWRIAEFGESTAMNAVVRAHPIRPGVLDELWMQGSAFHRDLARANVDLAAIEVPADPVVPLPDRLWDGVDTVLFLVAEGLSPSYVSAESMPYFTKLRSEGIDLRHHYSTGNCTHYGLLGLFFGRPVTFFKGRSREALPTSKFLDVLHAGGFESQYVGGNVVGHRHIDGYMGNFSRPIALMDDWAMVPFVKQAMQRQKKQFLTLFFNDTHYPYKHEARFDRFQPEVAEDFDYAIRDLAAHKEPIRNRYRNCLLELDAWIQAVLAEVDLERTIVVITGDHGEAFFERGRIGHASALEEQQIRVPCVIRSPLRFEQAVDTVSSHADVMPILMNLLREGTTARTATSCLQRWPEPAAFVALDNYKDRATHWGVITKGRKSLVDVGSGGVEVANLLDLEDRFLPYGEGVEWQANLRAVRRLARWLDR